MTELEVLQSILEVGVSIVTLLQFAIGFGAGVWMMCCIFFVWRRVV